MTALRCPGLVGDRRSERLYKVCVNAVAAGLPSVLQKIVYNCYRY